MTAPETVVHESAQQEADETDASRGIFGGGKAPETSPEVPRRKPKQKAIAELPRSTKIRKDSMTPLGRGQLTHQVQT